VELLARRLGLPPRRPAEAAQQQRRDRLLSLHEEAAKFFQSCLRNKAAQPVQDYLAKRGLSRKAIEDFSIGYAPGTWDALLKAMAKRGYATDEVVRAGLAVAQEDRAYDRFRDRVIFPIWDPTGRVIAFGGRAMQQDQQAKYVNSPETPIFQKGRTLYAFDRARRAMAEAGRAVVVEGYLDAIACHEAGLGETVATMGTALTSYHVELLRRRVPGLVLAFDADSAGLAAALRGREQFQQAGLTVQVMGLPEGSDPDRVIRDQGAEAFHELVSAATPMMEWELRRILAKEPRGREGCPPQVLREAVAAVARLPAGVEREYYVRWLAQEAGEDSPTAVAALEGALRAELGRHDARRTGRARRTDVSTPESGVGAGSAPQAGTVGRVERAVLAAFMQAPNLVGKYLEKLEGDDFSTEEGRSVFAAIRGLIEREEPVTPQAVLREVEPEARELLAELAVGGVPPERIEESVRRGIGRLLENRVRRQETELRRGLEAARSEADRQAILRKLSECTRRRSELAGERIVGEE